MVQSSKTMSDAKKKLRDRRSQQALRDRRKTYLDDLEKDLAACKRDHRPDAIHNLMVENGNLRLENDTLKTQQRQIQSLVATWAPISEGTGLTQSRLIVNGRQRDACESYLPATESSSGRSLCGQMGSSLPSTGPSLGIFDDATEGVSRTTTEDVDFPFLDLFDLDAGHYQGTSDQADLLPQSILPTMLPERPWYATPLKETFESALEAKPKAMDWLSYPEIIASCPPVPGVLDLLYQTRQNFLANAIAKRSRKRGIDVERLAFGWLVYVYCKWLVSPTPETFGHIPKFLWPVESQMTVAHSNALDLIIWPRLRDAMIRNVSQYRMEEVLELLSCSIKLRWNPNEDPLEPGSQGHLKIRPEFFDTLMREDGWTISSEFVDKYPALSQGINPEAILSIRNG